MSPRRKSFVYLVRRDGDAHRLLVLQSLDEAGFEVPKGSVEEGETYEQAAVREVQEEAGVGGIRILRELGITWYEEEEQHFLLAEAPEGLPDVFEHTVTGDGIDAGLRYAFHWEPINFSLAEMLVQGCGAFVLDLVGAIAESSSGIRRMPLDHNSEGEP